MNNNEEWCWCASYLHVREVEQRGSEIVVCGAPIIQSYNRFDVLLPSPGHSGTA